VLQKSDVKTTSLRYWMDYLDDTAIKYHALDPSNFGHPRPNRGAYLLESDLPDLEVPEIETLALFWDFDGVTTSDTSGQFTVNDVSSGSVADSSRYGWLGNILKMQHTGRGDEFPVSNTDVVENLTRRDRGIYKGNSPNKHLLCVREEYVSSHLRRNNKLLRLHR
jgi:hypothetical protein